MAKLSSFPEQISYCRSRAVCSFTYGFFLSSINFFLGWRLQATLAEVRGFYSHHGLVAPVTEEIQLESGAYFLMAASYR